MPLILSKVWCGARGSFREDGDNEIDSENEIRNCHSSARQSGKGLLPCLPGHYSAGLAR